MSKPQSKTPRFDLRLLIKHPRVEPEEITTELGLIPNLSQGVGGTRRTPKGTTLTGTYDVTTWSHWLHVERARGFNTAIANLVQNLVPHAAYLADLVATGGSVTLIIELPGDVNMGDVIEWSDLSKLVKIHAGLGIEVFPEFG